MKKKMLEWERLEWEEKIRRIMRYGLILVIGGIVSVVIGILGIYPFLEGRVWPFNVSIANFYVPNLGVLLFSVVFFYTLLVSGVVLISEADDRRREVKIRDNK